MSDFETVPVGTMPDPKIIDWKARTEKAEADRDALAAHVERLHAAIHEAVMMPVAVKSGSSEEEELQDLRDLIGGAISEKPTTSLARRDARMKAEALEEAAEACAQAQTAEVSLGLQSMADEYRRQAEEQV